MANIPATRRRELASAERLFPGKVELKVTTREYATAHHVQVGQAHVREIASLLPCNIEIWEARRQKLMTDRVDRKDPEQREKFIQKHREAATDGRAFLELANYRIFEMVHDVMAVPFAGAAFQTIDLSKDELPMIVKPRSRNLQRFAIQAHMIGGHSRQDQWRTTQEVLNYEMEMHRTSKVEYPLTDLQTGDYAAQDIVAQELAYDKEMEIDRQALAVIDNLEMASGLRQYINIHPRVDINAIPDSNYLDLTDVGTYGPAHTLTIERIKAILNHLALFGAADQRSPLQIKSMHLSPLNMRDSWDYVSLVSGYDSSGSFKENQPSKTVPEAVRDEIFRTGMFTSAWGYSWSWNPNSQIPRGRMYVFTNEPVGWFFTKSEYDRVLRFDDSNSQEHLSKNVGEQMLSWTGMFVTPDLWKHRLIIIDF